MAEQMEVETVEMMEDGEVPEDETSFKRERKTSETTPVSFTSLDEEKLKKRAERFGISCDSTNINPLTKEQMLALYESLGISPEEVNNGLEPEPDMNHGTHHRLEAIHLRGTEDMSTQDVFEYFQGHSPASIEWINDYSCNVVWLESWQAAKAMLEKSHEVIKLISPNNSVNSETADHDMATEETAIPPIPTPPGIWRKGQECLKAKALLLRFATRNDRKVKGAEKMSQYYRVHGNPNYGGLKGLISTSRKRRLRGKPDPVEVVVDSKNPWGALAEAWGANEDEPNWKDSLEEEFPRKSGLPTALVRRLGHQPPRPSPSRSRDTASEASDPESGSSYSDSDASESSNQEGRSRKKRMRMRMYADEEEDRSRKRKSQVRLSKGSPSKEGRPSVQAQKSRPVHARLGPVVGAKSDLRGRLGSTVARSSKDTTAGYDDHENSDSSSDDVATEKSKVDLRSKLQSRAGVK